MKFQQCNKIKDTKYILEDATTFLKEFSLNTDHGRISSALYSSENLIFTVRRCCKFGSNHFDGVKESTGIIIAKIRGAYRI